VKRLVLRLAAVEEQERVDEERHVGDDRDIERAVGLEYGRGDREALREVDLSFLGNGRLRHVGASHLWKVTSLEAEPVTCPSG
jgi:hypothetical protein